MEKYPILEKPVPFSHPSPTIYKWMITYQSVESKRRQRKPGYPISEL